MAGIPSEQNYNAKNNTLIIADSILKSIAISGLTTLTLSFSPTAAAIDTLCSIPAFLLRGFTREYAEHPNVKGIFGDYSSYLPYGAGFIAGGMKAAVGKKSLGVDNFINGALPTMSYEIVNDLDYNDPLDGYVASLAIETGAAQLASNLVLSKHIVGETVIDTTICHIIINTIYIPLSNMMTAAIEEYYTGSTDIDITDTGDLYSNTEIQL